MNLSTIPNIITILRIILIVPLLLTLLTENFQLAFVLFFFAGLSDGIDGFLARRYGWTSHLGSIMDPIADKLLMMGSYISLAWLGKLPIFLVALVVGRDVIVFCGAVAANYIIGNISFEPTRLSKLNTALQIALVFFTLLHISYYTLPMGFHLLLMLLVIVTTLSSLVNYVWVWSFKAINRNKR